MVMDGGRIVRGAGLFVPEFRRLAVGIDAAPLIIHDGEIVLRLGIALAGQLLPDCHRLGEAALLEQILTGGKVPRFRIEPFRTDLEQGEQPFHPVAAEDQIEAFAVADGDARPVDQEIDNQRPPQYLPHPPVEGDRLPLRPGERGPHEGIARALLGNRQDDEFIIRVSAKLTAVGGEVEVAEQVEKLLTLIMGQLFPARPDHQFCDQGEMKVPANGGDKLLLPLRQRLAAL